MKENWARWGESDEAGALNRIGDAQVRDAAALVRTGEVFSLAGRRDTGRRNAKRATASQKQS